MKQKNIWLPVFLFYSILSHAQFTLKLKPYVGYCVGYCSYGKDGKPIHNGAYDFKKLSTIKFFPNLSTGFFIEFNINSRSYFQTGMIFNEGVDFAARVSMFVDNTTSHPGYHTFNHWTTGARSGLTAKKYPLWFCTDIWKRKRKETEVTDRKYGNKTTSLSLLAGMTLVKVGYFYSNPTGLQGSIGHKMYLASGDSMVVNYSDYIPWRFRRKKNIYEYPNEYGFSLNLGLNYHIYNKKGKELLQLSLNYEKGTRIVAVQSITITQKNNLYFEGLITRGTTLHFNILFPITLIKIPASKKTLN